VSVITFPSSWHGSLVINEVPRLTLMVAPLRAPTSKNSRGKDDNDTLLNSGIALGQT